MHRLRISTVATVIVLFLSTDKALTCKPNAPVTPSCADGWIQCNNGRCTHALHLCDGKDDCGDMTDESPSHCQASTFCGPGQFRCDYRKCIQSSHFCDGCNDCRDMTDESAPYCQASSFKSTSASGEVRDFPSCGLGQFRCNNGECIPASHVCDGADDCEDKMDELLPNC